MFHMPSSSPTDGPRLPFASSAASLPVGQLESLRSKASQIIDSIQQLQLMLEQAGQPVLPPWPDILSKYNILLSQSHNLSTGLVSAFGARAENDEPRPLERLALHPTAGLPEQAFDNELIPLLRNQQTTDVLRLESATVRRLQTRLGPAADVTAVRDEHDRRAARAVRAVGMLRDKYDWHVRVEVLEEEPEELGWDPRLPAAPPQRGEEDDDDDSEEELEQIMADEDGGSSAAGTPMMEG